MTKVVLPATGKIRLFRLQDRFLTDPMSVKEARSLIDGYPGEYELHGDQPKKRAKPKPAAKPKTPSNTTEPAQEK